MQRGKCYCHPTKNKITTHRSFSQVLTFSLRVQANRLFCFMIGFSAKTLSTNRVEASEMEHLKQNAHILDPSPLTRTHARTLQHTQNVSRPHSNRRRLSPSTALKE